MVGTFDTLQVGSIALHLAAQIAYQCIKCRDNSEDVPLILFNALADREKFCKKYRNRRDHFAFSVGLAPKAKGCKLTGIDTIHLKELKKEYPPSGHDIYETAEVRRIWEEYRATISFPDSRGDWKPYHQLDPRKLQHVVEEDSSVIIRDHAAGEIVGAVIRNFSNNNTRLLEWINGIIVENNNRRKSVRVSSISKFYCGLLLEAILA